MSARAILGPILLLAAILSWQSRSCADEVGGETAVQLGHDGLALYEEGKWHEAFARFKEANITMYSPVFLLYMARCQRNAGRLREAGRHLEELLARELPGDAPASWRNALRDGRAELEALRSSTPSVRILPEDLRSVTIDDVRVQAGAVVQLNPGSHTVRGWSADGRLTTRLVVLGEGERNVDVPLSFGDSHTKALGPPKSSARVVSLPQLSPAPPNLWRTPAWIVGGAAVASALVGTVSGLMAKSQLDSVRQRCDGQRCPSSLKEDADRARLLANVSTAAFAVAGLDAAVSVTFLLLPPSLARDNRRDRR